MRDVNDGVMDMLSGMPPRSADPHLRDRIISTAAQLLATDGAVSARRLARELGTSTMVVYTHSRLAKSISSRPYSSVLPSAAELCWRAGFVANRQMAAARAYLSRRHARRPRMTPARDCEFRKSFPIARWRP